MATKNKSASLIYILNSELQEEPFQHTLFSEEVIRTLDANKWWRSVAELCNLQACSSSIAATERIFFKFSFVHSKIQNRLTISNVSKLVFSYNMLEQELFCNDDCDEA